MNNYPNFFNSDYQIVRELGRNREGGRISYLADDLERQERLVIPSPMQEMMSPQGRSWS